MGYLVPIEYLYVTVFGIIAAVGLYLNSWNNHRVWNPEGKIFIAARKEGLDVLDMVDPGTNTARFVLGVKDKEDDPVYDKDRWGLHADPAYTEGDASPERHANGLNIQHVSTTMTFPISPKNTLAQKSILKHRNDKAHFKELGFLNDRDLLVLLNSPANHLAKDSKVFIEKYKPMVAGIDEDGNPVEIELDSNEMIDRIKEYKAYCQQLPIETGNFSYAEYFRNTPYAHSSQTTQRINYLFEMKAKKAMMGLFNIMNYAVAACMIIAAGGVCIYLISMVFGS